jgi:hypothetical protein
MWKSFAKNGTKMKTRLQQFITRQLVRFKYVKQTPVDIEQIGQLVNKPLPETIELETPGGLGELTILGITLTIAPCTTSPAVDCIHAEVLCNFSVKVKDSLIYNTHLMLIIEAQPNYCKKSTTIGISEIKIAELQLISDQYSMIKDTTTLLNGLIPKPLNSIVSIALNSTKALLNTKTVNRVTKYLSLYTSGSKQMVIDYHRADIEKKFIELTQNNAMSYRLDESDFEEQLFAEFGEEIMVKNGRLFFVFA